MERFPENGEGYCGKCEIRKDNIDAEKSSY